MKKLMRIGIVAVVLIGFLGWFIYEVSKPMSGTRIAIQGRDHVPPGQPHDTYTSNPPVSGPHYPSWSKCGIFDEPQPVELMLHNLEHGHIVIYYKKEGSENYLSQLIKLVREELTDNVILTPNDNISSQIEITSWGWHQSFDNFDPDALEAFYDDHLFKAPERISCEKGI